MLILILFLASHGNAEGLGSSVPLSPESIISKERRRQIYDNVLLESPVGAMIGGVIPQSYEEMIAGGHDAPISIIQFQHNSSREYWKKQKAQKNSQRLVRLKMDAETFGELNLRAADVWDQLTECNGNSPEAARRAFFAFERLCSDPAKSKIVSGLIKEVAQNYQHFLISTPINDLSEKEGTFLFFEAFEKGIHPLIVQFAINQWALFLNHPAEEAQPLSWLISAKLNDRKTRLRFRELEEFIEPLAPSEEAILRVVVNNLIILTLLNGEHLKHPCAIYGLWPAMNRILFRFQIDLHGNLGTALWDELRALDSNASNYCGISLKYLDSGSGTQGIYGDSGTRHILNLRIMYQFYVGSTWEKQVGKEF